ncbi:hypothetical protein CC85DRAFT_256901 [Cutaneotrichosporon oleaginosum]|uniref:S1 motif domain-containing protein n=1 Tax=Cutaneotrichosporon oleaginosum TaxID=879819 RepID=A0A0J1B9R4_9TREE|nr:uncharacterized protein CC85DRAFT_256901 [Cutaneotrichosporon oleaginosum]KLT44594.1 hypothetical protein CC85DRAFT_256901 [Cutaneotrichosporon oleaginosum]TXT13891.1 hypothetical protein COLE_00084 [Cutaneotrichosporon oleaginosum]
MAPPKTSKKRAADSPAGKAKKARTDAPAGPAPRAAPAFTSALKAEEVDFPRGGGTTLTPLEVKQVRAEGRAEADAEGKPKPRKISERHAKRLKKATGSGDAARAERDKDTIRVEELSYKRLVPGTLVLGRVHTVLPLHLVVSLPNNLLAHVPITEVSNTLTAALNKEMNDDEDVEMEDEEEEEGGAPELPELFAPGQYVAAKVLNAFPTASQAFVAQYPVSETTKLAARIELTLIPEKINGEVAKADLTDGFRITGEVLSKEDKGYRVGLGLGESAPGVEGFLRNEEVDGELIPGQLLPAIVKTATAGGRVLQLSIDQQTLIHSCLTEVSNIGSLLPGTLVSALITAVVPSGLNVKLCGFYDGTIDLAHLGLGEDEIEARFKIGKKLKARVLYDFVAAGERRFALSVLPHIFNLSSPLTGSKEPLEEAVPIGKTLASVKITRVIPDWGVVARTDDGVEGFCHISHLTDERLATLSHSTVQFKSGTYHRARVIGHSPLDGVLLLSFEPRVLNQVFMAVGELEVGQVLKGTVKRLSDKGLFVNVQGSVDGVVWPLHYADIRLKHPEKRFKPGSNVKARVWALEPARNRVVLTLKKSLVDSDLPVPKAFDDVKEGEITPAVVSKLLDKGCLVDLFGGLRAFVPQSEAAQGFVANLADIFYVGKPVTVRITDVDTEASKLVASVRQALPTAVAAEKLEVGAAVKGIVAQIHAEQVVVTLVPSQLTALLSLANLSNHRGMGVDELRKSLKTGEKLDDLVVVSKNEKSGLLIVANKRREKEKIPSGVSAAARSFDDLQVGDVVPGRVVGKTTAGAMLRIGKHIRGRVHPCDEADDLSNAAGTGALRVDDNVLCAILAVDSAARTVDLSTRKSRVNPDAKVKVADPEITSFSQLKEGQAVRGLVRSITPAGLFVSLGRNITARVMIKELFDDFVKDWKPRFAVNQLVAGKILSVSDDRAEMTLRTKPREKAQAGKGKLRIGDFAEGQKVTAAVTTVETYGLFLRIDGSDVSGLCHRSEIADNKKTDVAAALKGFRVGDAVRAVIIALDKEKGRVNFSIKASHFADEFEGAKAADDDMDEDEEEGEDEDEEDEGMDEDAEEGSEEDEEEEGFDDEEADSDADLGLMGSDDEDVVRLEDESDDDEEDEEEIDTAPAGSSKAQKKVSTAGPIAVGGFDWAGNAAESDSDSEDESSSDAEETVAPKKKGKGKVDLTADAASARPQSESEFERALLASPNSSYLWIQYMSFLLSLHEVDRARSLGRRALDRIAFREEEEKLNVWMALVNLELGFGTAESADKVFKEAVQFNDGRAVYTRYIDALIAAGKDASLIEATFNKMLKKYSAFPETWARFAEFHFSSTSPSAEKARALLPRALQSLDKKEHVEVTKRFALLEYKLGSAERGKTLFEGILERHPKRLDVWNVYVDAAGRAGDMPTVRGLVDRALSTKMNAKRAKFVFKKWLALESRAGDKAGMEKAKARAREWVAENAKVESEGESESESEGSEGSEGESDDESDDE